MLATTVDYWLKHSLQKKSNKLSLRCIRNMGTDGWTLLGYCLTGKVEFNKVRTDNQIKNFFYCRLRKLIRNTNKSFKVNDSYKSIFKANYTRTMFKFFITI